MLGIAKLSNRHFASAEALLEAGVPTETRCIVADIRLGEGMDGVRLLAELQRLGVRVPVVMMTAHADVALAVRAMRQGAVDFIEKPFPGERLVGAVADATLRHNADAAPAHPVPEAALLLTTLSGRERDVLECLVAGQANKMVAFTLGISSRTGRPTGPRSWSS